MKALGWFPLFCVALAGLPALGQEPGQTPRPQATEPVREVTDEERVRLDKDFPAFAEMKDDAPFAFAGNVIMDARRQRRALAEEKAYDYVLAFAHKQPVERMQKYSIKNVPIENLFKPIRQDYLRELVHVDGRLLMVLTIQPTDDLKSLEHINQLYEAWVKPKGSTKLVCLVVPDLPEGVSPGEDLNVDVSFDAYYFMLWHYETRHPKDEAKDPEKKQWEKAPLFLGNTFQVRGRPVEESTYTPGMLYGMIGGLTALVLATLGMAWYFRRGDRTIHADARRKIEETTKFDDSPEPAAGPVNRIADQF
jgi:hypothetical protein